MTQLDYTFDRQIELEREDAKREGIERGIDLGIGQGEVIKLITQTCKKKRKGIPPREAAEMLEEDELWYTGYIRLQMSVQQIVMWMQSIRSIVE